MTAVLVYSHRSSDLRTSNHGAGIEVQDPFAVEQCIYFSRYALSGDSGDSFFVSCLSDNLEHSAFQVLDILLT